MSFQGSINQLLTMAGTAAMLNPTLRAKVEKRQHMEDINKREKALTEQLATVSGENVAANIVAKTAQETGQVTEEDVKDIQGAVGTVRSDLVSEAGALTKEKFLLDPNEQNLNKLIEVSAANEKLKRYKSAQESAQQSLNLKQEEVRPKAKRKSLKDVQVDFGDGSLGTVRDLPKSWQKQISEQVKGKKRKDLLATIEPKENK